MFKIIGLTGFSCTGKTTFSKYAENKLNATALRLGEYLRNKNVSVKGNDVLSLAQDYKNYSLGNFFEKEISECKESDNLLIVDSIRTLADYNFFKQKCDKFYLIMFLSDLETRYSRLVERKRSDNPETKEHFLAKCYWEMEFGLNDLFILADFHCIGSSEKLSRNLQDIIDLISKD